MIYILIIIAVGFAVAWAMGRSKNAALETALTTERKHAEERRNEMAEQHGRELETERRHAAESRAELEQRYRQELEAEKRHAEEMRAEFEKQQEERGKLLQEELRSMAAKMLSDSRKELTAADKERLDALLTPLKERLETFQKTVSESSKEGAQNKTEIKTAFEEAMKRLHEEQERTVRELKEQTEKIGNDAASLTQALKGDSKMQGDWGEMILDKTLEDSGLVKDSQYFLQENYKDEDGNNYRPDAVVVFPNGDKVVIDSKVSLTAYLDATRADNPDARDRLLREHVASVKAHVNELSVKSYETIVPGCIGYVLMFIPYESGYSAAIKADPGLLNYAYKKRIIILSPSNLLMALQLTHTMWQNYRMNKNVEEILRQSNDLCDKFVTFAETFVKIEGDIQRLHDDFDKAKGQLRDGKGNIVRRLDGMKALGLNPKKQIPESIK